MYIIDNIFSNKVIKKLIKDSEKVLEPKGNGWWCPNLSKHPNFRNAVDTLIKQAETKINNLRVDNAWIVLCKGDEVVDFHNHPLYDYSIIYYLETTPENSGTLFESGFVKTKQNSLLIFDSKLKHKIPSYKPLVVRKTLVLDVYQD